MSRKLLQSLFSAVVMAGMLFSMTGQVRAMEPFAAPVQTGLQPQVSYAVQHDLSAPLAELAIKAAGEPEKYSESPMMEIPRSVKTELGMPEPDGALQQAPVTGNMPATIANFDGISNVAGVAPPDTQGDIGYDPATGNKYYMQWVNLHIQAWNVTNPAAPVALFPSPIPGNQIWSGFGGVCSSSNDGDPIVLYDEQANRWFISQFAVDGPYYNCIAVSQTSDPAGAYYRYAFLYSNTKMNDYPKYGIWPDGYYMTVNQFTNASTWGGAGVAVYEREQMLTGGVARQVIFDLESVNNGFGGMLPVDYEGTPPPPGTPAYFAEVDDSTWGLGPVDEMRIWRFSTNWATNTFTFGAGGQPNQVLPVANFNLICEGNRDCVPQPGVTQKLDAIGDRLMYRLAYRHLDSGQERMVVNHSVDAGSGRAAVRWYELQKSGADWAITQQGTYAGDSPTDTIHRWMGSISMDRMGNLALGYSMSSGTVFPSVGLVGRLATDPANTLPQGELIAFSGAASQNGVNRWGDYSSMSIDPQDGCTFWFTTEYSAGSWDWHTRIVSFKYPSCTSLPTGTIRGTVRDGGGNPIAGVQVSTGVFGGITAADGTYMITAPAGTYNMTATAFGYLPGSASGVVVVEDQVTVQDFTLTAATTHLIYGVVRDATVGGHNWPLGARIEIAGFPGGAVFSDPITGYYEVELPQGFSTTLTVNALVSGYGAASQAVTVGASNQEVNFGLLADMVSCAAPGYTLVGGFQEKFDGVTAPALPANWAFVRSAGTGSPLWATNAGTRYPSGNPAVSAPNVAYFNSYSVTTGNAARLYYNQPFNMTSIAPDQVSFQMFHDTGWSSSHDTLQVVVSTDGGTTWIPVGPIFDRLGTLGWTLNTVDLSAYSSATSLLIGFNAVSAFGNDIHIDDVTVGSAPTCIAQPGSLLAGNVIDLNTMAALNGAMVTPAGADPILTGPAADPAWGDGFYYGFVPAGGSVTVEATAPGGYGVDSVILTVGNNNTVHQDFSLPAGMLTVAPTSFAVTLPMDATDTRTLTLGNDGTLALDFSLQELNLPLTTIPFDPNQDPMVRHLGPKNFNKYNLDGVAYYLFPDRSAPMYPNAAAGTLISSFASGLTAPWGVGVDLAQDTIWVGSLGAGGGDDLDHEFTRAGTATGDTMDTATWMDVFAADMAYDPIKGTLWQVNVGGDNCIYEMDPTTLTATGGKICPAFGTSERGLAYDPISDTFFAGSWNDSLIKRFDRDGNILQQVNVSLPIAGLAYNPMTGHLFVTNNGTATFDINVLDVNANYANLGGFNVTALNGGEAGLEMTCDGHLWAANQTSGVVLEIDSGETGACAFLDIPWLSENPALGTVVVDGSETVTLTFDAGGLLPGVYEAQLKVVHGTPYSVANIPVTLTVTPAAHYGTLEGIVSGLDVCDVGPGTPLRNAAVKIYDNSMLEVASLLTDAAGHYIWAGPITGNDYTVEVSLAGFVQQSAPVTLTDGGTVTRSFDLRPILPCISAAPASLEATVLVDGTASRQLVLTNTGAGPGNFNITEQGGGTLSPSPLATVFSEGFEGAFPPSGWTTQVGNPAFTWKQTNLAPHTGTYGVDVEYNPALVDQDEWLLTPEYALASGTLTVWSAGSLYWCRDTYDNCDANVWLVVGAVGGPDDVFVGTLDDSWITNYVYEQSTFNLDALLPGVPVRIGFQYTGNDGAQVAMDDISLVGEVGLDVPWLAETPITGTVAANGGTTTVTVDFDAAGLALGSYAANLRIVDDNARLVTVPVILRVVGNMMFMPVISR